MQKIKKVFVSLVIFCLVSLLIPFNISADSSTYSDMSSGCTFLHNNWFSGSQTYRFVNLSTDTRGMILHRTGTDFYYLYFVSDSPFLYSSSYFSSMSPSCSNPSSSASTKLYNGTTYYYFSDSFVYNNSHNNNTASEFNEYAPIQTVTGTSYDGAELAIRYTYGDLAVDPSPSFNYGDLVVGFHTNFSASGTTNNYTITNNTNLDTIEWENVDSNGNDLSNKGLNVEIRAVPILYSANSKSALDLLGFQDAVVDSNNGLILWQGNFNDNHKSFIWNDVIHQLHTSNPAFAITSLLTGSVWTRYGWIYQIRYNDVLNGYSSDWQTIYNSTSIKVSDSEKIVNQYYYHYPSGVGSDDQDIFHDINTVNNTTNNWYVNDVPVDPDASWLDSLIQAIADILGKILDFFSSIFDGLVDLLLGLFGNINPADSFFNWFSDLFNGIGDIDLTLPQFNLPTEDLSSFNRLVQETMDIFSLNNFGFVLFIPLLLIIIKVVF